MPVRRRGLGHFIPFAMSVILLPASLAAIVDIGGCILERVLAPDGSLLLNSTCPISQLSNVAARLDAMEARMATMEAAITTQAGVALVPSPPPSPGPPPSPPSPPPLGLLQSSPGASCRALAGLGLPSGTYWVSATQTVSVYCDMTSFASPAALVYRKMVRAGGCSQDGVCSDGSSSMQGETPTPSLTSVGVHKLSDADINALRTSRGPYNTYNNLMVRPMYGQSPWGHFELGRSFHKVRRVAHRLLECADAMRCACSQCALADARTAFSCVSVDLCLLNAQHRRGHCSGLRVRCNGHLSRLHDLHVLDTPGDVALVPGHVAVWVHIPADPYWVPLKRGLMGHDFARPARVLLHAVRHSRLRADVVFRRLGSLSTASSQRCAAVQEPHGFHTQNKHRSDREEGWMFE